MQEKAFCYFTTDSNVFAGVASLLILMCNVLNVASGNYTLPGWVVLIKYVAAVAVGVTFFTVIVFLGPTKDYRELFTGECLYLHGIGPLLTIISFCFLETGSAITWEQTALGVLPTLIYGIIYMIMAVGIGEHRGGWHDFYGFNRGGKWPVSFVLMLIGTYGLCILLQTIHNAMA